MRTAIVRNVEPEIFGCRDTKRQLIVFAGAFADQDFAIVDLQSAEPPRWRRRRGGIGWIFSSGRNLARDGVPRIPILNGLQSLRLLFERCTTIPDLFDLFRDDGFSTSRLLIPLEHLV